jgi:uncharacterized membrane protein
MPKKFDTNPLDPDFPEKAKSAAANSAPASPYTSPNGSPYRTAEFPTTPSSVTEDETRRFKGAELNSYAFPGAPIAPAYQPPRPLVDTRDRKVAKVGLPEKWLIALPYVPFWIGLVAGLILLLLLPKEETKVRFHAAQGLAAHLGILIVTTILGVVSNVSDLAEIGSLIFGILATVMLVVFAIKAWQGKPILIGSLEDLTNWLEEKIGPIKS